MKLPPGELSSCKEPLESFFEMRKKTKYFLDKDRIEDGDDFLLL